MPNQIIFSDMSGARVHEKVLELAKPYLRQAKILVAGAGEGSLEFKLISEGVLPGNIVSVDYDPSQFKLKDIKIQFCDLNKEIPFEDNSFDICFSTEVIEHLYNPNNLINETYRVLKLGGMLFLTTPNVHSIMQKIRYLFSDRLGWFFEKDFLGSGHIHPIFDWLLKRMIRGKFKIIYYTSQSFHLRLITKLPGIPVPFRHRLFAVNNIYMLKKL